MRSNIASQKVLLHAGLSVYDETDNSLSFRISRAATVSG
jgi:hypothetical protein